MIINREMRKVIHQNGDILKKENERNYHKELKEIRSDLQVIEKERKNNVIINYLDINADQPYALLKTVTHFIRENVRINTQSKNNTKIGKKVCVVEMKTADDKREIIQNKAKLKRVID